MENWKKKKSEAIGSSEDVILEGIKLYCDPTDQDIYHLHAYPTTLPVPEIQSYHTYESQRQPASLR